MMKNIWIGALIAGFIILVLPRHQSFLLWLGGFLVGLAVGILVEKKGAEAEREG